jgi:hypothetical protein
MKHKPLSNEDLGKALDDWPNAPRCPCCDGKMGAGMILGKLIAEAGRQGWPLIYPFLGAVEGFRTEGTEYGTGLAKMIINVTYSYYKKKAEARGDRPGVNDELMTQWLITRRATVAREIYDRAQRQDEIGWTCKWMLRTQTEKFPQLYNQLTACGPLDLNLDEFPITDMTRRAQAEGD